MKKSFILIQLALTAFLLTAVPFTALGEEQRYMSSFPPSDDMIIKKAIELKRCQNDITNIIGKLEISENIWTVYYEAISDITKEVEVYDEMELKKLDTGIWILECFKRAERRSYDTFYDSNRYGQ